MLRMTRLALIVGLLLVLAFGTLAVAAKPDKPGGGGCDRPKFCPQVYAPVICDNGKVYPNQCYADKKCATGCVPYDWF